MARHIGRIESDLSRNELAAHTLEGHALADHRATQNGIDAALYSSWLVDDGEMIGATGPVSGDALTIARNDFRQN